MKQYGNPMTGLEAFLILFIYLKLTNQIDWSWWWVFSPVWGTIVVVVLIWLAAGIYIHRWNWRSWWRGTV